MVSTYSRSFLPCSMSSSAVTITPSILKYPRRIRNLVSDSVLWLPAQHSCLQSCQSLDVDVLPDPLNAPRIHDCTVSNMLVVGPHRNSMLFPSHKSCLSLIKLNPVVFSLPKASSLFLSQAVTFLSAHSPQSLCQASSLLPPIEQSRHHPLLMSVPLEPEPEH